MGDPRDVLDRNPTDDQLRPFRWGILGAGGIASAFAQDLTLLPGSVVQAVASRSGAADAFGDRFGVPRRHREYRDLVEDPEVDAVYVAAVNPHHLAAARLALEADKPTLVEKPFAIHSGQARELARIARERRVFLMEAMWTRFLPHIRELGRLVEAGELGDLRSLIVDHGQRLSTDPAGRVLAPELGGGALLDLGVYSLSLASLLFGRPARVYADSFAAVTGVDAHTTVTLSYDSGAHALTTCCLDAAGPNTATVTGTRARVEIPSVWHAPSSLRLVYPDGRAVVREFPHVGHGLRHQAAEVVRCVRAGLTESPLMPVDETIAVMETMDEARRQIGLVYPDDAAGAAV